jgi:hypothetical protein
VAIDAEVTEQAKALVALPRRRAVSAMSSVLQITPDPESRISV